MVEIRIKAGGSESISVKQATELALKKVLTLRWIEDFARNCILLTYFKVG